MGNIKGKRPKEGLYSAKDQGPVQAIVKCSIYLRYIHYSVDKKYIKTDILIYSAIVNQATSSIIISIIIIIIIDIIY